jgi:hypothetical protein
MNAAGWRRLHFWAAIAWMFPGVVLAYLIVYHMPDPHASFAILVVSLYAKSRGFGAFRTRDSACGTSSARRRRCR